MYELTHPELLSESDLKEILENVSKPGYVYQQFFFIKSWRIYISLCIKLIII